MMIKSFKIGLKPTKEQEELMWKSVGISRFAYNWGINKVQEYCKQGRKYSINDIRKDFTQLKKLCEYKWLNEVSAKVPQESLRNLDKAFKNYFAICKKIPYEKRVFFKNGKKIEKGYPKFKSKKKSNQSFYIRVDTLYFQDGYCNIEKIGKVKYNTKQKILNGKYSNPYCVFNGKKWYIGFGVEIDDNQVDFETNKDLSIGIDLGIKDLATCSNGMVFKNINKTKRIKNLKSKLKHLQRNVSRKYEANKQGNKYIKTKNIKKVEKQIALIYKKLADIRNDYIYQCINTLLKERPYRIVMEDLNIKGMMKNKHLSKAIQEQCFYKFINIMRYKCEWYGIEFVQADRFYPSSKTCSCCGYIKKDLKLKDRIYICPNCGLEIDRDYNASLNLMNYSRV